MAVSKSTQARIGFASMILIAGVAILTPTLLKLRSGEIGAEEVERPGAPIYALHAILRGSEPIQRCVSAWEERSGASLEPFTLDFVVSPLGEGAVRDVSGVDDAPALQRCLEQAIAQVALPPFEGEPQAYSAPFTP